VKRPAVRSTVESRAAWHVGHLSRPHKLGPLVADELQSKLGASTIPQDQSSSARRVRHMAIAPVSDKSYALLVVHHWCGARRLAVGPETLGCTKSITRVKN
jgi:hypothetical protein